MEELKGQKELRTIGKSWFILYKYYEVIDPNEMEWKNCSTVQLRKSVYERTRKYHFDWLHDIIFTSQYKLDANKFGKSGLSINRMAEEIYAKLNQD